MKMQPEEDFEGREKVIVKQRATSKNKSLRGIKLVLIKSHEASPCKNITHEECHVQVTDKDLADISNHGNITIEDQEEGGASKEN